MILPIYDSPLVQLTFIEISTPVVTFHFKCVRKERNLSYKPMKSRVGRKSSSAYKNFKGSILIQPFFKMNFNREIRISCHSSMFTIHNKLLIEFRKDHQLNHFKLSDRLTQSTKTPNTFQACSLSQTLFSNPCLYHPRTRTIPTWTTVGPNNKWNKISKGSKMPAEKLISLWILIKLFREKIQGQQLWSKIFQTNILRLCCWRPLIGSKRISITFSICQLISKISVIWDMPFWTLFIPFISWNFSGATITKSGNASTAIRFAKSHMVGCKERKTLKIILATWTLTRVFQMAVTKNNRKLGHLL